jgi:hypothetical protein
LALAANVHEPMAVPWVIWLFASGLLAFVLLWLNRGWLFAFCFYIAAIQ